MVVSAMTLSNEQKTTSALSSPSERPLQQIITREWIDGSNVERCGEAFLSFQETDIVHLDFAEELYSAVLDTATETWRLLSARQLVGRREVRAFKENLGRLYLWGRDCQEGKLATVLRQSDDLRDAVLNIISRIGSLVIRIILSDSSNSTLHQQVASLQLLIEKSRLIITSADSVCEDGGTNTDSESETSSTCSEDGLPSITAALQCDVDCLMDLVPTMERTLAHLDATAQKDHSRREVVFAVSEAARPWVSNVSDKFGKADTKLVERLGESNWQRFLTVRARMSQIASAPKDILAPHFEKIPVQAVFKENPQSIFRPLSMFHDSGLGSSIPSAPASSNYAQSVASHTSFITSLAEGEDSSRRVPPTPAEVASGEPFRCKICGHQLFNIKNRIDWKIHVFADLQPYICTFPSCEKELLKFPTRKLWSQHEFTEHRVDRSWNCPECRHNCLSSQDLKEHLGSQHKHAIHSMQLSSILHAAEVRTEQPVDSRECPLCKIKPGRSRRNFVTHVGRHMESIALAVLPHDPGDDSDGESVTSTNDRADLSDGEKPLFYVPRSFPQNTSCPEFKKEVELLNAKLFPDNICRPNATYGILSGPGNRLRLAQHYVVKSRDKFPGGIFWIDCRSSEELGHEWKRMARELPEVPLVSGATIFDTRQLKIWFESRHNWVIVINGMTVSNEVGLRSLRDFLPNSAESSLIFVLGESDDLSPNTEKTFEKGEIYVQSWDEYASDIARAELCLRCGMPFYDSVSLAKHILDHHPERPERCPMLDCEHHQRGFALKYNRNCHFLTHFDKTITCNFCHPQPDGKVQTFSQADAFKRHLSTIHGVVECTNPSKHDSKLGSSNRGAKCSICAMTFVRPQALYDHLDDCIYDILSKDPKYDPHCWSSERSMLTGRPDASLAKEVPAPPLERLVELSSLDVALKTASHAGFMEPSNTLLVDNIPQEANEQVLEQFFSRYGEIESIHIPGNDTTGLLDRFAYICFSTREAAVNAFEQARRETLNNYRLRIRYAHPSFRTSTYNMMSKPLDPVKEILEIMQTTASVENSQLNERDEEQYRVPVIDELESKFSGGLRIPRRLHQPIFDCPFNFLSCHRTFSSEADWISHSLIHFNNVEPPRSINCRFCDQRFQAETGLTCWYHRMKHTAVHHTYGARLAYGRPDSEMYSFCWQNRILSNEEYRELHGYSGGCTPILRPMIEPPQLSYPRFPLGTILDPIVPRCYVRALYDRDQTESGVLGFHKNDIIYVLQKNASGWWYGSLNRRRGWFRRQDCDAFDYSFHDTVDSLPTTRVSGVDASTTRSEEPLLSAESSTWEDIGQDLDSQYECRVSGCLQSLQGQKFANLADYHNHCDDVHRYIPFSKESFEVEPRKDNGRQIREFLNSYAEPDSGNGSALIGEPMPQAPVVMALDDLPFKCPLDNCPYSGSTSAGFAGKEDLRSHINTTHNLDDDWTQLILDSALPCTVTDCVKSLPGQGFASKEHFQSHFDIVHLLQRTNSRLPGIQEDIEEAATDRQYACVICHPLSVYHQQMFTAETLRDHLVSAHRMATDAQKGMSPYIFTFSNQTQADFEVQPESKNSKTDEHAQMLTSSQAPFAIPLKPTVQLPPVRKP